MKHLHFHHKVSPVRAEANNNNEKKFFFLFHQSKEMNIVQFSMGQKCISASFYTFICIYMTEFSNGFIGNNYNLIYLRYHYY